GAAAEVCEAKLASLERVCAAVELVFFDQRVEIALDLGGVLVGVNFEVTEFAAFAAEGYVEIEAKRLIGSRRLGESLNYGWNVFRFPLREGRIIRDEVIPDRGLYW